MTRIAAQDLGGEKYSVKGKVKRRVGNLFKTKIDKDAQTKSKVKHLLEGLTTWEPEKRALYINELSRY